MLRLISQTIQPPAHLSIKHKPIQASQIHICEHKDWLNAAPSTLLTIEKIQSMGPHYASMHARRRKAPYKINRAND